MRLAIDGHEVAVVDTDSDAFQRLGSSFGGRAIEGMALDREVLVSAGVERADSLAAVTGSDAINAVVARVAVRRFGVPRAVARLYDPGAAEIYRRLGVHTVSPVAWSIGRMAELLVLRDIGSVVALGAGQVDLVEAAVPALLENRPVSEMELAGEIRAAAVTRGGRTFVPDPATRLRAGDVVALAVTSGAAERLETLLGRRT